MLLDQRTGRLRAMLEGGKVNAYRTAAADIIVTATPSSEPLFDASWVRPARMSSAWDRMPPASTNCQPISTRGRRSGEEITVFDSSGISLQDLFIADALIRAKTQQG